MNIFVLLFCEVFYASKFINKWDADLLNGVELTIESYDEHDQPLQTTVGPITVGKCLGQGGVKSAFDLKNKFALLLPNEGVSQKMWERIVNEEVAVDKFYSKYIKTSGVKKATFVYEGTTNYALYSQSFEEYQNEGAFILDSKSPKMPRNFSDRIPDKNEDVWMQMLMPVVKQYSLMIQERVALPVGDMLSFLFAAKGSPHGLQDGPSVSMFAFDFTSKSGPTGPAYFSGNPFKLFHLWDLKSVLKDLMEDLLGVKNNDLGYLYKQTQEDKTFIKNVSEKCVKETEFYFK